MRTLWPLISASLLLFALGAPPARAQDAIPDDFPRFLVPRQQEPLDTLRQLMWLHYPGGGPKATLWDEWLSGASLWPAEPHHMAVFRKQWDQVLSTRVISSEGYVATHQHPSIAHQLGWPFPFWKQGGPDTWGWHFSLKGVPDGWHGTEEKTQEGWTLENGTDDGIHDGAWNVAASAPYTAITTPPLGIDVKQAPFMQLRWRMTDMPGAQPFMEWTTEEAPAFGPERRMLVPPPREGDPDAPMVAAFTCTMAPLYRHPEWKGRITRIRINLGNPAVGGAAAIQAFFTQYDTRHTINGQNYVRGCAKYFLWTGDTDFLRRNINRMRLATRFTMDEFDTEEEGVVVVRWVGHDGRSGIRYDEDGNKHIIYGNGIGNNYWDLMPMGHKDALATIYHYDALRTMAAIERAVAAHPEWAVPAGVWALEADALEAHAAQIKETGNRVFWNDATGRFACSVDIDGVMWDYGYTFLNLEAVYYGFATVGHARSILDWVCGDRIVEGDTAQGEDIYHWRFAPRATTKRNIDYYLWAWSSPESIPWGGQVQDGGACLGWSYHDLMSRLRVRGPDNAWQRLSAIIDWFDEVTQAGGYRKYYDGSREGSLQGGGTAGGLGLDMEFFESLLVPQIMLDGFMGFRPTPDGCRIDPKLPSDWPELTITRVRLRDAVLRLNATHEEVAVTIEEASAPPGSSLNVEVGGKAGLLSCEAGAEVRIPLQ